MQNTLELIVNAFPVSSAEFEELDKKFGNLAYYAAWQLKKKNTNNNVTNEHEDDVQELRIAMIRAASYYKRQTYIEACLAVVGRFVKDPVTRWAVRELRRLWDNRRHHGANRQRFGFDQEAILEAVVRRYVPDHRRPDRGKPLTVNAKFGTYCKHILWNGQKSLGKHITREKAIRTGMVSLSEHSHLAGTL